MVEIDPIQLSRDFLNEYSESSVPPGVLKLAEAMIELALKDIQGNRGRDKAIGWIMADDRSYILSFLSVCELLRIDPYYIRRKISEAGHLRA